MHARCLALSAILLLSGCGGGAATGSGPETANDDKTPPSADDAKGDSPAETGDEPSAGDGKTTTAGEDSKPAEPAAVTTLEGSDLESVLQALLSDAELLDHLHLNKSGRSPLKISGPNLPEKLKVIAGSYDVKVVSDPGSKTAPVLVFTKIEREGDLVRLHYRFDVEGIKGSATASIKSGHWVLASNRVIEK